MMPHRPIVHRRVHDPVERDECGDDGRHERRLGGTRSAHEHRGVGITAGEPSRLPRRRALAAGSTSGHAPSSRAPCCPDLPEHAAGTTTGEGRSDSTLSPRPRQWARSFSSTPTPTMPVRHRPRAPRASSPSPTRRSSSPTRQSGGRLHRPPSTVRSASRSTRSSIRSIAHLRRPERHRRQRPRHPVLHARRERAHAARTPALHRSASSTRAISSRRPATRGPVRGQQRRRDVLSARARSDAARSTATFSKTLSSRPSRSRTVAHEYQHLINASRRMYVNTYGDRLRGDVARRRARARRRGAAVLRARRGLAVARTSTRPTLREFDRSRERVQRRCDRRTSGASPSILKHQPRNSPYADNDSLATRGATWSFLRWAADHQYRPDGPSGTSS